MGELSLHFIISEKRGQSQQRYSQTGSLYLQSDTVSMGTVYIMLGCCMCALITLRQ